LIEFAANKAQAMMITTQRGIHPRLNDLTRTLVE